MSSPYLDAVTGWYAGHARDLPWRAPDASAWSVMVSEIMLQQTPVIRVLPAHAAWLQRWPEPADLAAASVADAVRQWDRLGYPRRAVRLHASASVITQAHSGQVPADFDALLSLPGVGGYTAAAIASFAYGQRHAVLDTNVRRVLARLITGTGLPPRGTSVAEIRLAESLLPADGRAAARWSVGMMELGALVCTAGRPRCHECPLAEHCVWLRAGKPVPAMVRGQARYEGSDRQCRGRLLGLLRTAGGPLPAEALEAAWTDAAQRNRSLAALITDGLVSQSPDGSYALPGEETPGAETLGEETPGAETEAPDL